MSCTRSKRRTAHGICTVMLTLYAHMHVFPHLNSRNCVRLNLGALKVNQNHAWFSCCVTAPKSQPRSARNTHHLFQKPSLSTSSNTCSRSLSGRPVFCTNMIVPRHLPQTKTPPQMRRRTTPWQSHRSLSIPTSPITTLLQTFATFRTHR
ncbi:hypothetical protein T440DRAFT_17357 [Plenodomus tracheiphilus IPT5]|uniref:Uncharacterized protein n=1 Tax=Plenodomus tracheiphilus IPT5 TaxID=1408161 RepID=A0A6A7BEF1_9PLEO|nr:hypothetical protein T440DRAFT_17357 [Plenodomus tracheiphilus IPT5]